MQRRTEFSTLFPRPLSSIRKRLPSPADWTAHAGVPTDLVHAVLSVQPDYESEVEGKLGRSAEEWVKRTLFIDARQQLFSSGAPVYALRRSCRVPHGFRKQIEAGRPIKVITLLRICEVFEITMDKLVRGLDKGLYEKLIPERVLAPRQRR